MKLKVKKLEEDLSPTQKSIYLLLGAYGSLSVGDTAKKLEISRSTASKTLNCLLARAILYRQTTRGRRIEYSINYEEVKSLESQMNEIKLPLRDKIKNFLESELLVISYIWEKQSNPFDDTTGETVSSLAPPESGCSSWVETHRIFINNATLLDDKDEDGALVKVDLTAFYSKGNEDDRDDDVPEEKWEAISSIYYVRVRGENEKNMKIEALVMPERIPAKFV
ncbi:MAG: hypothetical protein RIG63_16790 [Coleofasciculus chthonoplastes F3-SA18-01]|uniref:hypothetical protein n=1 Tax=Coleofasciculus chthonoplastes TaxID=64178 RepID=UPI0032FB1919